MAGNISNGLAHFFCGCGDLLQLAGLGLEPAQIGLKGSPTIVAKVDTVQLPSRQGKNFEEETPIAVSLLLEALRKDRVIR